MSQAVATKEDADQWRKQLQSMEPQFQRALPAHVPVERFVRATETAVMRDPELRTCDRKSLFQAIMQCAESGLMPNGRDAALVRFKSQVQFIPMIGGILRLMRNTGEVQEIVAEVVCEKDEFDYRMGDNPKIEHKPAMGDRGVVVGAYAVLKTKDGGIYREFMSRGEIDKIRNVSRAKDNGPWQSWFEEMARKTVLRRLAKKCPLSTDTLMDLTSRDDGLYDLSQIQQPPSRVSQLQEALKRTAIRAPQGDEPAPADEVETEANPEPEPEPERAQASALKENAVYQSTDEAMKELQAVLARTNKIDAIEDYLAGWADMVDASFADAVQATAIKKMGRGFVNTRKLELQKKAAK